MRLCGRIQGADLIILLDSGSYHTFASSEVATKLCGVSALSQCLSIQIANGAKVKCDSHLLDAE
jgi:hypothetical protein